MLVRTKHLPRLRKRPVIWICLARPAVSFRFAMSRCVHMSPAVRGHSGRRPGRTGYPEEHRRLCQSRGKIIGGSRSGPRMAHSIRRRARRPSAGTGSRGGLAKAVAIPWGRLSDHCSACPCGLAALARDVVSGPWGVRLPPRRGVACVPSVAWYVPGNRAPMRTDERPNISFTEPANVAVASARSFA
jgi:hypothetical protein